MKRKIKKNDIGYYMELPYKTESYYNPEDKTWTACHPELGRGSCYAVAPTEDKARKLLKEEKKFIIEHALSEGKKIPEPEFDTGDLPSGNFVVRLPKSLHKKLKDQADKEGVSLNLFVSNALAEYTGYLHSSERKNVV